MRLPRLIPVIALLLAACGEKPAALDEATAQTVTLPSGQRIRVEVMIKQADMMHGMMFREALPPDRGMLFVHARPGRYTYWMHNVRVPLDIIWLDKDHRIVEISANTPPCTAKQPVDCPQYGGHGAAQFVLELNGGMAERYGLKTGDELKF
jgi:uncharacterized protein